MSVKEIRYGNAIVVIHRPTLTEEEQTRRIAAIKSALRIVGKELNTKGVENEKKKDKKNKSKTA